VQQQWPVHLNQRTSSGRAELDGDPAARPARRAQGDARQPPPRVPPGLRFNEHMDHEDGLLVFAHACKLGFERIVSEPRNSFYRSGRWLDWIKSKNPDAPAVRLVAIPLSGRPPSQRYCHSGDTCGAGTALLSRASTACHFALVRVSLGHAAH
jgi:hypothetical protein